MAVNEQTRGWVNSKLKLCGGWGTQCPLCLNFGSHDDLQGTVHRFSILSELCSILRLFRQKEKSLQDQSLSSGSLLLFVELRHLGSILYYKLGNLLLYH